MSTREESKRSLQDRLLKAARKHEIDGKTGEISILLDAKNEKELRRQICKKLLEAYDDGKSRTPQSEIERCVLFDKVPENSGGTHAIAGGIKDFKRRPESARLIRHDGAWVHFTLAIKQLNRCLELRMYNFELVLPNKTPPGFLRFDLNPPAHANEIRSHFHPGNEMYSAPAPVFTPDELLDIFFWEFYPRNPEKPRGTTSAEPDELPWYTLPDHSLSPWLTTVQPI